MTFPAGISSSRRWTVRIIRMRKEVPEIGWGDFVVLRTGMAAVLALRYDWRGNSVVAVHNLSGGPQEIWLDLGIKGDAARLLVSLLSEDHSTADDSGKHCILLEPYGYRWYRVGGLDALITRTDV